MYNKVTPPFNPDNFIEPQREHYSYTSTPVIETTTDSDGNVIETISSVKNVKILNPIFFIDQSLDGNSLTIESLNQAGITPEKITSPYLTPSVEDRANSLNRVSSYLDQNPDIIHPTNQEA